MKEKNYNKLKTIFIIVLTLAIGFFALNQAISLYYKAELIMQPCELCQELNPQLESCFGGVVKNPSLPIDIDVGKVYNLSPNIQ